MISDSAETRWQSNISFMMHVW